MKNKYIVKYDPEHHITIISKDVSVKQEENYIIFTDKKVEKKHTKRLNTLKNILRKKLENDDAFNNFAEGIFYILIGIVFYVLAKRLPEWMVGMMAVGGIVLWYLIRMVTHRV